MQTDPRIWIAALSRSHARLVSLIDQLTDEQLTGPSYASQWSIAQVLSHLGSGAEISVARLVAAAAGEVATPGESNQAIWDRWNAKSPQEQARDCRRVDEQAVRGLQALDDAQLAAIHVSLAGMELDAAGAIGMRLSEHAIHVWDVAVALDAAAVVSPDAVELLVDRLALMASRIGKPGSARLRLRVHASDPERRWLLAVEDGVRLESDSPGPADGELRLPAEAFLRLVYGRMDPQHTPALALDGWDGSLDDLRRVFPGF
ncbi:MAG TPA: maleylpyruvate isomerase family mycothiol-dependent enzyme [Verrucomicrobiae bacterium]|nr:maleylpyruvate isomerase family mycothiol-dependent enzyme [Verrucomicrobiae bacterium]